MSTTKVKIETKKTVIETKEFDSVDVFELVQEQETGKLYIASENGSEMIQSYFISPNCDAKILHEKLCKLRDGEKIFIIIPKCWSE